MNAQKRNITQTFSLQVVHVYGAASKQFYFVIEMVPRFCSSKHENANSRMLLIDFKLRGSVYVEPK